VPTSAVIESQPLTTYSNQTWISCDQTETAPNKWGYQRCVTYQVKNQDSKDYQKVLDVHEDVQVIDENIDAPLHTSDSSTNADGEFLDGLVLLGNSANAIPANACSILKQTITVTGNKSPIRVNCLRFGSTDVTITDVTLNPSQCSKPTYQCN